MTRAELTTLNRNRTAQTGKLYLVDKDYYIGTPDGFAVYYPNTTINAAANGAAASTVNAINLPSVYNVRDSNVIPNVISTGNSVTLASLEAGAEWIGTGERVAQYGRAGVSIVTDNATDGTLYIEVSRDGVNYGGPPRTWSDTRYAQPHMWEIVEEYFRIRYVNGSTPATNLVLQTQYSANGGILLGHQLDEALKDETEAIVTRSVLVGKTGGNNYLNTPVTPEGHLEVAIHDPILPFGSLNTESLTPIFQTDAVYGINTSMVLATTGHLTGGVTSGTNTGTNNLFTSSTGTTALSFATIQSRKRLRYRAGQGIVGRFAGLFSTPAASSILVAGFGTGESGYYFGYNGTTFGILHSTGGIREIQTLTVTVGAGGAENVTVTLGGTATIVAVTAGTTTNVAYQLSQAIYTGWDAFQRGATVIFLANSVGNKTGAFTLTSTGTTTGTFAETLAGVASTDTWYPQTEWNGDVCDGTSNSSNTSGFNLNPQKGNVFQIDITYLGFGPIIFKIMTTSDGNNPTYTIVHTLKFPNTRTTTTLNQPSFPFTQAAYSAGSTTNVYVSTGSFGGFVAGQKELTGPRMTYSNNSTSVASANYHCLATIRNDRVYNTRANQSVVNLLSFGGAIEDTTPVTLFLIKNATLAGTPNFQQWSTNSCTYVDTAATTCTFSNNDQILVSLPLGADGNDNVSFEDDITLQPGETVTLAARTVTGTAAYVLVVLNTREDQ